MLPIDYNLAMASVNVGLGVREQEKPMELGSDAPFRIAILGDFSGRANRNVSGELRAIEIDPSSFCDVMRRLNVALDLPTAALKFCELNDFHPDQLYQNAALFSGADNAAAMRAILSHPDFQALEAAWRSLFFFFRYVQTGTELHVELIDVSSGELYQKLPELHRIFAHPAPGEPKWSAIIGLFTFSACGSDCELLARLGMLARMSGAPFLSSIDARLFGCESIAASPDPDDWNTPLPDEHQKAWVRLRQSDDASWIGLAFPRFLLRLPYGKETSAIDSFEFEEAPEPAHDSYLWGNPAIACATLLGQAFNREGWEMRARSMARIDGIPRHTPRDCDPAPPAEIWMTERFAGQVVDAGVMPLASVEDSDALLLMRFQSIADPAQPLAGPW